MACTDADTISAALLTAAAGPKSAESDGQRVESHSIPDLIALENRILGKCAARNPNRGLRFTRLIPPGSV